MTCYDDYFNKALQISRNKKFSCRRSLRRINFPCLKQVFFSLFYDYYVCTLNQNPTHTTRKEMNIRREKNKYYTNFRPSMHYVFWGVVNRKTNKDENATFTYDKWWYYLSSVKMEWNAINQNQLVAIIAKDFYPRLNRYFKQG